ncbi:hypothetical protein DTO006G1_6712 [Penicillium roqueforti]|nr:hypothetical protein CBS147337_4001 [Penicillium roqueforti]KAI2758498.1 hypothetical protein DTO006G1_6712 [Penicillium roqueforti]KAI3253770.1 hypothetical protein DTO006G7_5464 [Penicillium roqueforti]
MAHVLVEATLGAATSAPIYGLLGIGIAWSGPRSRRAPMTLVLDPRARFLLPRVRVIIHLLWVNILVVALNILLLLTEYKLHYIQVSFKTVVYCIKLKLEFSVLNRLRSLVHSPALASPPDPMQQCRSSIDMNLFQAYFSRPIVALDMATPSSTGPVGVIRCDSPSSSIPDYHGMLREISDGGD